MPIEVVMSGVVLEAPVDIETDTREPCTAFLFGDRQLGLYRGREAPLDALHVCEVISRGELAEAALRTLVAGSQVWIQGALEVSVPLDWMDDRQLVAIRVEARTLALTVTGDEGVGR